jgi:Sulfotransferase family
VSRPKEPRYFDNMEGAGVPAEHPNAEFLNRTIVTSREAYEALFAGAGEAKAIGEASPSYLRDPVVPPRVRAVIPHARLVAILRDPVERAYSAYLGSARDGHATAATFADALSEEELGHGAGRFQRYAGDGRYAEQLKRWYAHFPREQVRVYLHDDLRDDAPGLLRDLHGFLGVDPGFVPDTTERRGVTGVVANPALRAVWKRAARARRVVRPILPVRVRDSAYRWVVRDLVRPPMPKDVAAELRERLRPEILALQDLIGRDLSHWLSG